MLLVLFNVVLAAPNCVESSSVVLINLLSAEEVAVGIKILHDIFSHDSA